MPYPALHNKLMPCPVRAMYAKIIRASLQATADIQLALRGMLTWHTYSFVQLVGDRIKDKKMIVRHMALEGLSKLYGKYCAPFDRESLTTTASEKFGWIPSVSLNRNYLPLVCTMRTAYKMPCCCTFCATITFTFFAPTESGWAVFHGC